MSGMARDLQYVCNDVSSHLRKIRSSVLSEILVCRTYNCHTRPIQRQAVLSANALSRAIYSLTGVSQTKSAIR